MLIIGDLSGIQDFLFDVRESGGKQATSLRFRSFRLQIIAECLARRFLWACQLDEDRLKFVAAGKFLIDASAAQKVEPALRLAYAAAQEWLMDHTHGRLRLAVGTADTGATLVDQYDAATSSLQRAKLCPWLGSADSTGSSSFVSLVTEQAWDAHAEAERDARQGRLLLTAEVVTLNPASDDDLDAIAGVAFALKQRSQVTPGIARKEIDLNRLSRYVPHKSDGSATEFVELAATARGASMLGVLKADADSLGAVLRSRLTGAADLAPLQSLSKKLEQFFGAELNEMISSPDSKWSSIYTVFAGGDDLLLVGPWDIIIDLAGHVREVFLRKFKSDGPTISAGCATIKPKLPIRLAAQQAEELLERAKSGTKDQFALLGDCWKWSLHAKIIGVGKQLASWVDLGKAEGGIERGWLHTLLELALLQRGQADPRDSRIIPAMASSRLAYHVARNWPKTGAARQWVDAILKDFDRSNMTDPVVLHLPAIIRYAMLATCSPSDKE